MPDNLIPAAERDHWRALCALADAVSAVRAAGEAGCMVEMDEWLETVEADYHRAAQAYAAALGVATYLEAVTEAD